MRFKDFDLFLFDLDGLLIDSEAMHWRAYKAMCAQFGCTMTWDLSSYLVTAGSSADALQQRLREEFPQIFEGREWSEIYALKQQTLFNHIRINPPKPMPGAKVFVQQLKRLNKPMVVVTHSPREVVDGIQGLFPEIDRWITREDYVRPKPAPDGYLCACRLYAVDPSCAIGFEDTVKGIRALEAAGCHGILVNVQAQKGENVFHSFTDMELMINPNPTSRP